MILVHAAVVPQPRQCPFRDPAPRQYLEAPAWEHLFSRSMFRPSLLHFLAQASSTFSGGGFAESDVLPRHSGRRSSPPTPCRVPGSQRLPIDERERRGVSARADSSSSSSSLNPSWSAILALWSFTLRSNPSRCPPRCGACVHGPSCRRVVTARLAAHPGGLFGDSASPRRRRSDQGFCRRGPADAGGSLG